MFYTIRLEFRRFHPFSYESLFSGPPTTATLWQLFPLDGTPVLEVAVSRHFAYELRFGQV